MPAELTWLGWSAGEQWLMPTYQEVASGFARRMDEYLKELKGQGLL